MNVDPDPLHDPVRLIATERGVIGEREPGEVHRVPLGHLHVGMEGEVGGEGDADGDEHYPDVADLARPECLVVGHDSPRLFQHRTLRLRGSVDGEFEENRNDGGDDEDAEDDGEYRPTHPGHGQGNEKTQGQSDKGRRS